MEPDAVVEPVFEDVGRLCRQSSADFAVNRLLFNCICFKQINALIIQVISLRRTFLKL